MKRTILMTGILMLLTHTVQAGAVLTGDTVKLGTASVTAKRSIVKMDVGKLTYNVEADPGVKTLTVLEMLRKVPTVTVDGQDNIRINGKQGIKILVDGKENPVVSQNAALILKMMPAEGVKKVEVIVSPGAKYDAEGVGGVLNLITTGSGRKAMHALGANAQLGTRNQGGGVNGSLQRGKLSLSGSGTVMRSQSDGIGMDMLIRQRAADGAPSETRIGSQSDNRNLFAMGQVQVGYELDSLRLLSARASVMQTNVHTDSHSGLALNGADVFTSSARNRNRLLGVNAGVDYQRTFRQDRLLTVSYLFTTSPTRTKEDSRFALTGVPGAYDLTDRQTDTRLSMREHTVQLDYTTPWGKCLTLDAGAKFIGRDSRSDVRFLTLQGGTFQPDKAQSLDFENTHAILAAYSELSFRQDKWSATAGLRYENTWDELLYRNRAQGDVRSDYRNLVPSAKVGYSFSFADNLGLTYNLRINRPAVAMLSPFVNTTDPTTLRYGNPGLDVERTHTMSATFNHIGKVTYNASLTHSLCDNGIGSYTFARDGLLNETYGNVNRMQQTTLGGFATLSLTRQTKLTLFANGSYTDLRSPILAQRNSGFSGTMMLNIDQTLPKGYNVSGSLFGMTRTWNLQGYMGGFGIVTGTVKKDVTKQLTLTLTGMTTLDGNKLPFALASHGEGYSNRLNLRIPVASVTLAVTYRLGGTPTVKRTRKSIVNDDVKQAESQTDKVNHSVNSTAR